MQKEVRFIHTADVHLGRKFKYLSSKAKSATDHLNDILFKIADIAIDKKVDIIFISGDLFDNNNPNLNILNKFIDFAEELNEKNIKIVILPGTHDFLSENSIYRRDGIFKILPNIYVFKDQNEFFFEDLSLAVYGLAPTSNKMPQSPITPFSEDKRALYHVIMAHGSLQIEGKSSKDDTPIEFSDIENSFADYIALGHWHQNLDFSKGKVSCFYSGSPELIDLDQINSGFVIYGNLKDKKFENIKVGEREFDDIIIDVSKIESLEELLLRIKQGSNKNLIRKIKLTGEKHEKLYGIDIVEIQDILKDYFYFLLIEDDMKSLLIFDDSKGPNLVDKVFKNNLLLLIEKTDDEDKKNLYTSVLEEGLALLSGNKTL